jgi:Kae1-associated kinase Bud32
VEIIKQGAEAILYLDEFEGEKVLVKERIKKKYRIDQIDQKLRKERTRKEVKLLTEARKFGTETPKIFHVDQQNCKIIMEYVDGKLIKDLFNSADKKMIEKTSFEIGKSIGKMHSNGIIHGDLTTSNMILKDGKIYFIDFGLGEFSKRIEDQGVDLNLLEEAVTATHFKNFEAIWKNVLKGYKKEYADTDKVLKQIEEIEKRARYKKRD